eukprot:222266-Hanusia_phi.AAC.1
MTTGTREWVQCNSLSHRLVCVGEQEVVALFHGGEKKTRTRTRDEDKGGGGTDLLRLQTISSLNYLATPFLVLDFSLTASPASKPPYATDYLLPPTATLSSSSIFFFPLLIFI